MSGSVSDDFLQALLEVDHEWDDPFARDGDDPFAGLDDGFPDGFDNCFPDRDLPGGYDLSFLDIEDPFAHGRDAEPFPTIRTGDDRMATPNRRTDYATRGYLAVESRSRAVLGRTVRVTPSTSDALAWAARDGAAFFTEDGKWAVVGACLAHDDAENSPRRLADPAALAALAEHRLLRMPESAYSGVFGIHTLSTLERVPSTRGGDLLVQRGPETRAATVGTRLTYGHMMADAADLLRAVGDPLAGALHANKCLFDMCGGTWFVGVSRFSATWLVTEADIADFRTHAEREMPALYGALRSAADPAALAALLADAPAFAACAVTALSDPNAGASA